jgi:uncharacterized membrane protein YcaP (DUF421 family)
MGYLFIAASSATVYLFIIIAIRLFGKEEFSQLSITDLVFVLLISNAVQNAMVGSNTSLSGGLVAAGTLFLVNFSFKYLIYKFPNLSEKVQGGTVMLVYEGKLQENNLRKARVRISEIEEAAREHGVKGIEDINLAVLEMDGNISILSDDYRSKTKRKRRHYAKTGGGND